MLSLTDLYQKPRIEREEVAEREEREEREEGRIKRDIRGWIGWDFIEKCVGLCEDPLAVLSTFMTGGRATDILDYTRGMFADMGGWYEGRALPVYKRYRILEKIIVDPIKGTKRYITQLQVDRRRIPILKDEPLAGLFWDLIKDKDWDEPLLSWPDHKDQYWQLYKVISKIPVPSSPLAPLYHKGPDKGLQKNLYPHWLRGRRAAQLRVQYNLDPAKLCDFFKWKTLDMARHYAGLSVLDMVIAMKQGERFMEIWENMMGVG